MNDFSVIYANEAIVKEKLEETNVQVLTGVNTETSVIQVQRSNQLSYEETTNRASHFNWAGLVSAVGKISTFQLQGPRFEPSLCRDLNICVTIFTTKRCIMAARSLPSNHKVPGLIPSSTQS